LQSILACIRRQLFGFVKTAAGKGPKAKTIATIGVMVATSGEAERNITRQDREGFDGLPSMTYICISRFGAYPKGV